MPKTKREWHNPAKYVEGTTEGKCPYCKKTVKSLENHIHDHHKGRKGAKEKIRELRYLELKKKE